MPALGGGEEEQSVVGEGGTTQKRPSKVDDARAGGGADPLVQAVERKYTSRRLCMSASVLGAGVHGIGR